MAWEANVSVATASVLMRDVYVVCWMRSILSGDVDPSGWEEQSETTAFLYQYALTNNEMTWIPFPILMKVYDHISLGARYAVLDST